QVRAYRLLDNRSHEETNWDDDLLRIELTDLKDLGLDLDLTGFDLAEIDELFTGKAYRGGLTDADSVPASPPTPVSQPGDMWIAGDHRVLCADATAITSLELVLGGGAADMVFTDPPYNVDYLQRAAGRGARRIANDNLGLAFEGFLLDACRNLLEASNGAIYICMSSSELGTLKKTFTEAGGHWSTFII